MKEGRKEGRNEGRKDGRKERRKERRKSVLLCTLVVVLETFGRTLCLISIPLEVSLVSTHTAQYHDHEDSS
jgi:hypothetical protein